jgi:hypothetical protein
VIWQGAAVFDQGNASRRSSFWLTERSAQKRPHPLIRCDAERHLFAILAIDSTETTELIEHNG